MSRKRVVTGVVGAVGIGITSLVVVTTIWVNHRYNPRAEQMRLQEEIRQLSSQVQQLKQEQAMPSMVLNRYRNSICYIYGVYHVGMPHERPGLRARLSGTAFVVADRLLATNRHVAQPWYEDPESEALIRLGATPVLEKLIAFFPGAPTPVAVTPIVLSGNADLAILRVENAPATKASEPLPLADSTPPP